MIENPQIINKDTPPSQSVLSNIEGRNRSNVLRNFLRVSLIAVAGTFFANSAEARPPRDTAPAAQIDITRLTDEQLLQEVKKILGSKVFDDRLNGIYPEFQVPVGDAKPFELRDDGLGPMDFIDVSPAAKLAALRKKRAEKASTAARLKPILDEASRRSSSWQYKFYEYLTIPEEPHVFYADGALATISNKGLLDHVVRVLGQGKVDRILSWNRQYEIYEGRSAPVVLNEDESKKIAPYVAEADRRILSWGSRIKRRMAHGAFAEAEKVEEVPKAKEVQKKEPGSIAAELKRIGATVIYNSLPDLHGDKASLPKRAQIEDALPRLLTLLKRYPPNMLAKLPKIYLVAGLTDSKGNGEGGFATQEDIIINLNDGISWSFDHEIFHNFDNRDGIGSDNAPWARRNSGGMSVYTYKSGREAIAHGRESDYAHDYPGFASPYGKHGGPDEDQATIGQSLLSPQSAKVLLSRAQNDSVLADKLEMTTGCEFDSNKGVFVRIMTEKEYKDRFGFSGYQYYAKWSRGLMNAEYWNMIRDGRSPEFVSRN